MLCNLDAAVSISVSATAMVGTPKNSDATHGYANIRHPNAPHIASTAIAQPSQ